MEERKIIEIMNDFVLFITIWTFLIYTVGLSHCVYQYHHIYIGKGFPTFPIYMIPLKLILKLYFDNNIYALNIYY